MTARRQPPRLEAYSPARVSLRAAAEARHAVVDAWNSLEQDEAFGARLRTNDDGTGKLSAESHFPKDSAAQLDTHAAAFLNSVKAAMDAAVYATAKTVCAPVWSIDPDLHRMPLAATAREFDTLVPAGHLLGLRPDQVRVLRDLQPFADGSPAARFVGVAMSHLAAALDVIGRGERLARVWATNSEPELRLPDGATLLSLATEPDGVLAPDRLLATFRVSPPEAVSADQVVPNVALDLILDAPPWPVDLDDNLQARTGRLLTIAGHLVDGLERSVSTPSFIQQYGRLDDLAPTGAAAVWAPVAFDSPEQEAEVLDGLAQSDLNLASVRADDGTYTLLRHDGERVMGREIPQASPPEPSMPLGTGVEHASLDAAAEWGLPDFVFKPKVVKKGAGLREIGDGTIVTGTHGVALQVKARDGATDDPVREASWLKKKAGEGLRQAHGTIRSTLSDPNLRLTNFRGREIGLPGDTIDWVPVVILDHPHPPHDVVPDREPDQPGLIVLRRDWEFLWDQLRRSPQLSSTPTAWPATNGLSSEPRRTATSTSPTRTSTRPRTLSPPG